MPQSVCWLLSEGSPYSTVHMICQFHCSSLFCYFWSCHNFWQFPGMCFPQSFRDHDGVIKWKLFPRYWPFVKWIHRSWMDFPHKSHWRRAFIFSLICTWTNGWVNNRDAGDLRRHCAHYDVSVLYVTTFAATTLVALPFADLLYPSNMGSVVKTTCNKRPLIKHVHIPCGYSSCIRW